jgi:phenylacetic acid degradation operon negative regulatory protein
MVASGELRAADGTYELAGGLRRRQRAQDWALQPDLRPWAGTWRIGVVTPGRRPAADRAALRVAGGAARLAELREGVWGRPDNLPAAATPDDARRVLDAQVDWWSGRPDGDPASIAAAVFALAPQASRGRMLMERLTEVTDAVEAGAADRLAEAFVTGAAVLQHVRRDPLLPDALAPADWPGAALRAAYQRFQPVLASGARAWLREAGSPAR